MKFNKMVAVIAILGLAVQANAQSGGSLRRSATVAQNDVTESQVVILNQSQSQAQQAVQQPATVVEATPAVESRAEQMRKARQNAEVQTEQKIVEKLEESRLREEQQRAERLFGDRVENGAAQAPVAAPVVAPTAVQEQKQPTTVTIEKVEIVQPKDELKEATKEVAPAAAVVAPVATGENKIAAEEVEEEKSSSDRFYVGGLLGTQSYNASNVTSNFALGVTVGTLMDERWAVEGSFVYSNHNVDTFWQTPLYRELDQYEVGGAAKYYFMSGRLKPYVGGSAAYIYRKYNDRVLSDPYGYNINPYTTSEETHAFNLGLLGGLDFAINKNILIGGGVDWSTNLANKRDFSQYNLPEGSQALETIDFWTVKVGAKFLF